MRVGTYSEQVALSAAADGLKVFGGPDCVNAWKYTGGATTIASPSNKPALSVTGASSGVIVEDIAPRGRRTR